MAPTRSLDAENVCFLCCLCDPKFEAQKSKAIKSTLDDRKLWRVGAVIFNFSTTFCSVARHRLIFF